LRTRKYFSVYLVLKLKIFSQCDYSTRITVGGGVRESLLEGLPDLRFSDEE
jgi:hypothetical protein